jgi:hypothetical protein
VIIPFDRLVITPSLAHVTIASLIRDSITLALIGSKQITDDEDIRDEAPSENPVSALYLLKV